MPTQRDPVTPPKPLRALTLDIAWERAYRRLRGVCIDECANELIDAGVVRRALADISHQLTKDLIDAGVGGTLAYQLARPPSPE